MKFLILLLLTWSISSLAQKPLITAPLKNLTIKEIYLFLESANRSGVLPKECSYFFNYDQNLNTLRVGMIRYPLTYKDGEDTYQYLTVAFVTGTPVIDEPPEDNVEPYFVVHAYEDKKNPQVGDIRRKLNLLIEGAGFVELITLDYEMYLYDLASKSMKWSKASNYKLRNGNILTYNSCFAASER